MAVASGLGVLAAGMGCAGASNEAATVSSAASGNHARRGAGPWIETRDGVRLFHLDWGQGKPIVFLHAWALNADLWEYQMTALADRGARVIAYDRRGHGRSSDPGRGYDFDTLADDLAAVLDTLDLREVTLVGHSMGTGEIARYLARHGDRRIARTVLTSAITPLVGRLPDYPEGTEPRAYEAIISALKADRPAALTGGVGMFTGERTLSPPMTQWLVDQFLRSSPSALIGCMRAIATADFRADLRAFTMPTLIVHGDADLLNPLEHTGRKTARSIPRSRLEVYAGAPHGLPLTDRERFTQELVRFVGG